MADESTLPLPRTSHALQILDNAPTHTFQTPAKRINDGEDVQFFLSSRAYTDIVAFMFQLNAAMFPRKDTARTSAFHTRTWQLRDDNIPFSNTVIRLQELLKRLENMIEEAPPDTGPRRFGNVSFRKWYAMVEERISGLLEEYLPPEVLVHEAQHNGKGKDAQVTAKDELQAYLMGSFGSAQRLDYGTGHELSFLAFLGCIWKLGGFPRTEAGVEERGVVLGVIEPYLTLIRRLILTYTLEPAGSHGVWGLDDHFFIPYIFGSAQLAPAIASAENIPTEGSLADAVDPADVVKAKVVEHERKTNMYFSAIGFIYDVKKGPFWEHSPILFDISGIRAGWAKINKGMLKMYNAEVLSKFPVIQHFPFGSLFVWERDPNAVRETTSIHSKSQPKPKEQFIVPQQTKTGLRNPMHEGVKAPWAAVGAQGAPFVGIAAPWAKGVNMRDPEKFESVRSSIPRGSEPTTGDPWANSRGGPPPRPRSDTPNTTAPITAAPSANKGDQVSLPAQAPVPDARGVVPSTRAPWAQYSAP
ncbi:serine/threonine-protein phosphatase-like protein 2A activator 1 [Cryomyces antarcticus]